MEHRHNAITFGEQLKTIEMDNFVLTETFHTPGMILPRHDHECANINFTIEGSFREIFGKRPQECSPSSILVKPAGETHANQYGRAGAHCLIIEVKSPRLELIRDSSKLFDAPDHLRGGILSALAMKIYNEFRMMDRASEVIMEGLVLEMMGQAMRHSINASSTVPPLWLRDARDLIHEHFSQRVSLFNIAASVGVHPAHLARMFRRYYRYTVGDYIRRLRLEYAAQELIETERSLAEISAAAGFYDQSHFSQSFKGDTGLTPKEFRNAARTSKPDTKKLRISKTP
jgi:AraC family transcriptional regulator